MESKVPARAPGEVRHYLSQIRKKLQEEGFRTFRDRDGTINVWIGAKSLGNVGEHGEFYCNSNDLLNPIWKEQIEKIMQAIEEVNKQMQQAPVEIPEQDVCEMTLEQV